MIHYIYGESLERRLLIEPAIKEYQQAKSLFPVDHWKAVAQDSINRLEKNKTADEYFNTKNFNELLWCSFHKVYDFVYLNDFARYVCLSALARGSSEWPLSLVDFRTVLELEIKQCFPDVVESFTGDERYSLYRTIEKLEEQGKIDSVKKTAFDNIRIAGNIAAHNLFADEKYKIANITSFMNVLEYFNNYRKNNQNMRKANFEYPLCQLTLEQFLLIPDENAIRKSFEK